MFCHYCGTELPQEALFCNRCGRHLGITNHQESALLAAPPQPVVSTPVSPFSEQQEEAYAHPLVPYQPQTDPVPSAALSVSPYGSSLSTTSEAAEPSSLPLLPGASSPGISTPYEQQPSRALRQKS